MVNRFKSSFQRDKETFRELNVRQKLEFIWDYYKILIVSVLSVALLLLLAGALNVGRGEIAMYAVLINANEETESAIFDDLLTQSGLELGEKTVHVESSYKLGGSFSEVYDAQTLQVLAAEFAIGDLDLFAANEAVYRSYASQDAFIDLSLFIEKDILEKKPEDLYIYENSDGIPIIGGVWLRSDSVLHQAGYYTGDVLFGVVANAQNLDEALAVTRQILIAR